MMSEADIQLDRDAIAAFEKSAKNIIDAGLFCMVAPDGWTKALTEIERLRAMLEIAG